MPQSEKSGRTGKIMWFSRALLACGSLVLKPLRRFAATRPHSMSDVQIWRKKPACPVTLNPNLLSTQNPKKPLKDRVEPAQVEILKKFIFGEMRKSIRISKKYFWAKKWP